MSDLIEELLKDDEEVANARVMCGNRWLVWDKRYEEWIVREKATATALNSAVLYRGVFLIAAIQALSEQR